MYKASSAASKATWSEYWNTVFKVLINNGLWHPVLFALKKSELDFICVDKLLRCEKCKASTHVPYFKICIPML
jgi:ureidoglycolate hydrolase